MMYLINKGYKIVPVNPVRRARRFWDRKSMPA